MTRLAALAIATAALFSLPSHAQRAYILDLAFGPGHTSVMLPSSAYPAGSPGGTFILPNFASLPLAPPTSGANGGHAIDQKTLTVYSSDGFLIAEDFHNLYAPYLVPPAISAPLITTGGPITGLAVDSVGGVLYMSDGGGMQAFSLTWPYAPLSAPVGFLTILGAPISGLGFDPATGTIWACDVIGGIYNVTPAGIPIGPQPVAVTGLPCFGLTINTSNGGGSFPASACSAQLPGFHVLVTDGTFVVDALNPLSPPIPSASFAAPCYGLAYSSDWQRLGGGGQCSLTAGVPSITTNRPLYNGPAVACNVNLIGGPPVYPVTLMIDFCPLALALPIPLTGGAVAPALLWLNPFLSFPVPTATDAAGNASVTLPITFAPAGLQFSGQWWFADPTNPPYYICLSDAATMTVGLP